MKNNLRAIDITLVAMFVALMGIGANITSAIVIGGVPITLQTFFCILAGALLGRKLGALAMVVYALVGLVGAPIFANFSGGFGTIIKPTFGFILSFILAAYVTGLIADSRKKLPTTATFILAALAGMFVNYVIGTNWMYFAFKYWGSAPDGFSYSLMWKWMAVPLPKDIIFSVIAGLMAPKIVKALKKSSSQFGEKVA